MKKIFALVLAIAMMMTCSLAMADRLADIQNAGKLVVATSPDWPPYEYYDDANNIVGTDVLILVSVQGFHSHIASVVHQIGNGTVGIVYCQLYVSLDPAHSLCHCRMEPELVPEA